MIADWTLIGDALLKLMYGMALVRSPVGILKTLGMPSGEPSFYVRLLGSLLVGIGLALMIEALPTGWRGLGAGGAATVNFVAAAMLALLTIGRPGGTNAMGRRLLWIMTASTLAFGVLEVLESFIA